MKLITRPDCPHCQNVKEWLAFHRPNLKIEIEQLETKVSESPYAQYGDTAPILITEWAFVAGAQNIIDYLNTVS
jgi:glutaredoxin